MNQSFSVTDALHLLRSSFPVPLRLSQHPELYALFGQTLVTLQIIKVLHIEMLFNSGFMTKFLFKQAPQVCVFHETYRMTSVDVEPMSDSDVWFLLAPASSTSSSTRCPVTNCDVLPFPSLEYCLFHHHTKLAIDELLVEAFPQIENYGKLLKLLHGATDDDEEYQFPHIWSYSVISQFFPSRRVLYDLARLSENQDALETTLPLISEFRSNPTPTIEIFHQSRCLACPKLRCFGIIEHDLRQELYSPTYWDRFCAEHRIEVRTPLISESLIKECEHRDKGKCQCLIDTGQHNFCCHPCFVRMLYETRAKEPFPDCVGPPDIQAIIFSYMQPEIRSFCVLSW